jgi:hypothetical protein
MICALFAVLLGCDASPHIVGEEKFGVSGLQKLLAIMFSHPFTIIEETDLEKMAVAWLKAKLQERGLSIDGLKVVLLRRLQDHLNKLVTGEDPPPAPSTSMPSNHTGTMKLNDPNVNFELAK